MKRIIKHSWCFILFLTMLSGCFEPFDESLFEDSKPSLVVEANINTFEPPYEVIISKTAKPDDPVNFYPINNAIVSIKDDSGYTEFLQPIGQGKYFITESSGIPKNTYYLAIEYDDVVYTAVEIMPEIPSVDSFEINYKSKNVPVKGYYFSLFLKKRKDTVSYYKIDVSLNDSLFDDYTDLLVFDDSYTYEKYELVVPYAFNIDDTVTINVQGITNNMYRYYYGLVKQTTNLFSNIQPPMLNPPTNFSNQPLGYFQAASIFQISQIVKDPEDEEE